MTVPAIHPKFGVRAKSTIVVLPRLTLTFDCTLGTYNAEPAPTTYVPTGTEIEYAPVALVPWAYPPGSTKTVAPLSGCAVTASVTVPLIQPTSGGGVLAVIRTFEDVFVHCPSNTARLTLYVPGRIH